MRNLPLLLLLMLTGPPAWAADLEAARRALDEAARRLRSARPNDVDEVGAALDEAERVVRAARVQVTRAMEETSRARGHVDDDS